MISIDVFSEERAWSKKLKKKEFFFKKICKSLPKKYRFPNKKVSICLNLSNNRNIKKLNKRFRNKNKSTDILSFPFEKKRKTANKIYLGDIIISYNFMDRPRPLKLKIFKERVIKTFIHGYLHLLGYDHVNDNEYKKMLKEEKKLFESVISKVN
tara:strand:- start:1546 stop:2007 length:462 start_codon:yes stop_codon:yes gene_type:complete